ncbi:hypothetical protein IAU60_002568 [Kwoniella sp. DSM 27419]
MDRATSASSSRPRRSSSSSSSSISASSEATRDDHLAHGTTHQDDQGLASEQEGLLAGSGRPPVKRFEVDDPITRRGWVRICGVTLPRPLVYLFSALSILLIYGLVPHGLTPAAIRHTTLSNGTHAFHPTTLLISLDGFRPSYLSSHPHLLSNLISLGQAEFGNRAESMQPVFPTLTFPNHWSLMTGLYPESHGIIANDFWDPLFVSSSSADGSSEDETTGAQFVYTEEDKSWDARWWWGEPIWSVVERAKRKSAVIMWPGPPVTTAGIAPSYFVPYRELSPSRKLDEIFGYLDKELADRPEFIAAYFPEIDQNGHHSGPDSRGVNVSLEAMDQMVGGLLAGLEERNLTRLVNVVIVSDHGMTETSNERMIYLDDILGEDGIAAIEHKDGWPSVGLRFKEGTDVSVYQRRLMDASAESNGTFAVYTHETMPVRWHFSHGRRVAPIYIVPTLGWAITDHHEHFVIYQGDYQPKGNHGYDNTFPQMQAIFFAHGPVGRDLKKANLKSQDPPVLDSFRNLEIFSLITGLLGLTEMEPPHNGTEGFWQRYLNGPARASERK